MRPLHQEAAVDSQVPVETIILFFLLYFAVLFCVRSCFSCNFLTLLQLVCSFVPYCPFLPKPFFVSGTASFVVSFSFMSYLLSFFCSAFSVSDLSCPIPFAVFLPSFSFSSCHIPTCYASVYCSSVFVLFFSLSYLALIFAVFLLPYSSAFSRSVISTAFPVLAELFLPRPVSSFHLLSCPACPVLSPPVLSSTIGYRLVLSFPALVPLSGLLLICPVLSCPIWDAMVWSALNRYRFY
jgi:hypothetical protein